MSRLVSIRMCTHQAGPIRGYPTPLLPPGYASGVCSRRYSPRRQARALVALNHGIPCPLPPLVWLTISVSAELPSFFPCECLGAWARWPHSRVSTRALQASRSPTPPPVPIHAPLLHIHCILSLRILTPRVAVFASLPVEPLRPPSFAPLCLVVRSPAPLCLLPLAALLLLVTLPRCSAGLQPPPRPRSLWPRAHAHGTARRIPTPSPRAPV